MWFIVTEGLSVCLLVTFVSPANTAELIGMPIGGRLRGPNEPCILDGVQILLRGCPVH